MEDKGQKVSKHYVKEEQNVSVALLASRDHNCLGGGSEDKTIADSSIPQLTLLSSKEASRVWKSAA